MKALSPLAHRMRPHEIENFFGHEKHLAKGSPLRTWLDSDRIPSLLLWGPPGCGKTTLARVISGRTQSHFISMSAVSGSVKDIKEAAENAAFQRDLHQRKTVLFVDEIHRFNRTQQDALLPFVEDGTLTLIGATTENPSFEINSALLSRLRVVRLERIEPPAIRQILQRAIQHPELGLNSELELNDDALNWLSESSEGDARRALTALENLWTTSAGLGLRGLLSLEQVQTLLKTSQLRQPLPHDKKGSLHYDVISAFIKSVRDSDPDAALYYLARLLEAGEDPLFIVRRMVILASEDIGNADPRALQLAIAVKDAVDFLGMPEARIPLAQVVTYLSAAPKSNASYSAINEATREVQTTGALQVPIHLQSATGVGYEYSHDLPAHSQRPSHLPSGVRTKIFYQPKDIGLEKAILEKLRHQARRSGSSETSRR